MEKPFCLDEAKLNEFKRLRIKSQQLLKKIGDLQKQHSENLGVSNQKHSHSMTSGKINSKSQSEEADRKQDKKLQKLYQQYQITELKLNKIITEQKLFELDQQKRNCLEQTDIKLFPIETRIKIAYSDLYEIQQQLQFYENNRGKTQQIAQITSKKINSNENDPNNFQRQKYFCKNESRKVMSQNNRSTGKTEQLEGIRGDIDIEIFNDRGKDANQQKFKKVNDGLVNLWAFSKMLQCFQPNLPAAPLACNTSNCKVQNCNQRHLKHYCMCCKNVDSDHFTKNCPHHTLLLSGRCKVQNCLQDHPNHYCKVCESEDSDHFARYCPLGIVLYHGTKLIDAKNILKEGFKLRKLANGEEAVYLTDEFQIAAQQMRMSQNRDQTDRSYAVIQFTLKLNNEHQDNGVLPRKSNEIIKLSDNKYIIKKEHLSRLKIRTITELNY